MIIVFLTKTLKRIYWAIKSPQLIRESLLESRLFSKALSMEDNKGGAHGLGD
jgi:hypothetical protein